MVGGKAVVEAGAVTRRRVRCSAWLGALAVISKNSFIDAMNNLFRVILIDFGARSHAKAS